MIPNQAPDSTVAGFIQPSSPPILESDDFDDFVQQLVAGVTGMDGTVVRPRWQMEPPNLPPYGTDWAAVGIIREDTDWDAWVGGDDQLNDDFQRHQIFDVMCSFYGPHADGYAGRLRDGLAIAQNREVLQQNNMGLVEVTEQRRVPELIKNQWTDRADVTLRIRRQLLRSYPVRSLLEAQATVSAETPEGIIQDGIAATPFVLAGRSAAAAAADGQVTVAVDLAGRITTAARDP